MARTGAQTSFTPKLIAVAVAACFATSAAFANPTGPTVVNGTASFQQTANLLQITNSPNAIINWQSFSIGASEITRFLQQSASSAVLNRVITQDPSVILGALQSNGRVFLINPNGILFGAGAQIDVAGLVASTLNLSNADFLAGRLRFTEVPGAGSVINEGTITAAQGGSVYLVGASVTNAGVITTPQGEVILAAGNTVELVNPGTPNLRVEITAPDNEAINLGQIVADSGRVGIYAGLINNSGTIRADSAQVTDSGQIVLKATKNVTLEPSSVISASGAKGGEIIVLAEGGTVEVAGTLDASAPNGGDGGYIETSGAKVTVDSAAIITTAAPYGKTGTWLIDPNDFTIGALGTGEDITGAALSSDLGLSNVVITSNQGATAGNGDIFVNDAVSWSSGNDLTLTAIRDVNVNSAITSTGGGTVALNAGWDGVSPAATPVVTPGTGSITLNAPITMNAASGEVHLVAGNGITQVLGAPITANKLLADASAGSVLMNTASNLVNVLAGRAGDQFLFKNAQSLEIGSVGGVDGIVVNNTFGSATVDINVNSDLTVNKDIIANAGGSFNSATITLAASTGQIFVNSSTVSATGGSGEGGGPATVTLNAGNGITVVDSIITATGGNGSCCGGGLASVSFNAGTGSIQIDPCFIGAQGGNSGSFGSGGGATVTLTGNGITLVGGSTVSAVGGAALGLSGFGGGASVTLNGGAGGITVGSGITVSAVGGSAPGSSGVGGFATVNLNASAGGITVGSGSTVSAVGGAVTGSSGFGGGASVALIGGAGGIRVDGATISATGGNGPNFGGGAFVSLNADGNISVASTVSAIAGAGNSQGSGFVGITSNNGNITTGAEITADGGEGFITMSAPMGIIQQSNATGFLKALASFGTAAVNLSARDGIGTLANPIRIFDDQPDVFATNTTSGAVVLSQINNDLVIDDGISGIVNGAPGGLIAAIAETGNVTVSNTIDKPGNALSLSGASGLMVNDGANITADTLTLETTSPGASITLGNGQLSAVKTGLPVSSPALTIQAATDGDISSSANMSTASGELIISGRHIDLDVQGLGRTITSGGDVTITAAGRISANNFLPATAFVNIQGTDVMLTSGTDATLGDQRFIDLGHVAGQGNIIATSGPININAGTSFGGCVFLDCYQGTVQADANNISITTGTFFSSFGNVIAPAGDITMNVGTGLFLFAGSTPAQVNAGMNLTINAGEITLQGGTGTGAFAELRGGPGLVNITTTAGAGGTGDVSLTGGSGMDAFARIFGDPDVNMTVGGVIQMNTGTGSGAFASIESASADSITITFPNLASGGFFVNGVEGATSIGTSGFFAGGSPASLGQNLIVTYGSGSLPPPELSPPELPPSVIDQVVVANNQNVDVLADQLRGGEAGEGAPEEKKKELPVCR